MSKLSVMFSVVVLALALALVDPANAADLSITIGTPPPAPIVEAVPVAPGPSEAYVWRPGYWRWVDERHVWIPGHWAKRPHPGAEWVEPKWEHHHEERAQGDHDRDHDHEGYRFEEGHWK